MPRRPAKSSGGSPSPSSPPRRKRPAKARRNIESKAAPVGGAKEVQAHNWFFTFFDMGWICKAEKAEFQGELRPSNRQIWEWMTTSVQSRSGTMWNVQLERCPDTGRLHIQGAVRFSSSITKEAFEALLLPPGSTDRFWNEIAISKKAVMTYCAKRETRVQPTVWPKWVEEVYDPWDESRATPAQLRLLDTLSQAPDPRDWDARRRIYYIWSREGRCGKSTFVGHCALLWPERVVEVGVRAGPGMQVIKSALSSGAPIQVILFDLPRSQGMPDDDFWGMIEALKDGRVTQQFSGRGNGTRRMNPAHIVIFSNYEIPREVIENQQVFSRDRWVIECWDTDAPVPPPLAASPEGTQAVPGGGEGPEAMFKNDYSFY